jgi:phage regulator Rha-like protein
LQLLKFNQTFVERFAAVCKSKRQDKKAMKTKSNSTREKITMLVASFTGAGIIAFTIFVLTSTF